MTFKGPSGFAIMNPKFPVERFLKQYPASLKKPFLPVLYNFFGREWDGIEEFCNTFADRKHLLEFHLSFRNPHPNSANFARQITETINHIGNANTKVIICPVLEDNMKKRAWKKEARRIKQQTSLPLVRSSLRMSRGGKFEEKHGRDPDFLKPERKRIYNPDGVSIEVGDNDDYFDKMSLPEAKKYVKKAKGSHAMALWIAPQQGLQGVDNSSKAPPVDERDYIVTNNAIKEVKKLLGGK